MFQNLPLPAAQDSSDSSGVTPGIVIKVLHAVPENILVYDDLVPLQFLSRNVALVL